ncbi:lipocalin family protein [Thioalkalivibrio sp. ALJ1]|uniref:lipocalin family protein n=1 Tax=Thioalkalivibrio sp. ALJ1 TaxID=1158144 RepID=UPI00056FE2AB|nr:lipocalin family protein [Thioalkalivibrio sp. ALJ1]
MPRTLTALLAGLAMGILMTGCSSPQKMPTVDHVDLERYMGDWYVIANIPTFLERDAYNALEQYALNDDGTIDTTFSFNKGGFDGPRREYNPTGFVRSDDNAEWGMRFVWPFKAEFLIVYLDEDYSQTVIGRSKRDYVWIMAREPEMPEEDYQSILAYLDELGYDTDAIQRVPQRWD